MLRRQLQTQRLKQQFPRRRFLDLIRKYKKTVRQDSFLTSVLPVRTRRELDDDDEFNSHSSSGNEDDPPEVRIEKEKERRQANNARER